MNALSIEEGTMMMKMFSVDIFFRNAVGIPPGRDDCRR
jgi:hypothetical protein